jgi:hypothetical protein
MSIPCPPACEDAPKWISLEKLWAMPPTDARKAMKTAAGITISSKNRYSMENSIADFEEHLDKILGPDPDKKSTEIYSRNDRASKILLKDTHKFIDQRKTSK